MKWRILIVGLLVLLLAVLALPVVSAAESGVSADLANVSSGELDRACIDVICKPSIDGGVECKCRVNELPYFKIVPNSG